jgi:4-hydroxybenzoate polyprenyltransferase
MSTATTTLPLAPVRSSFWLASLRLLRPQQWIKNLLVFAALIFSLDFNFTTGRTSLMAFAAFCLVSSTVYILNDLVDAPSDRLHPEKKFRPIASRALTPVQALAIFYVLLAGTATLTWLLPLAFQITIVAYLILNLAYSFWLKRIFIMDVMILASGFVLRVIGGGVAIGVTLSPWIILVTFFVSLFMGIGKRKNEIDILHQDGRHHRASLLHYTPDFLNQLLSITAGMTVMSYALYTIDPKTEAKFHTANLIYTLPFVVYGIFRYFHLIYNHRRGGDPTGIFAKDIPMILDVLMWLAAFVLIAHQW